VNSRLTLANLAELQARLLLPPFRAPEHDGATADPATDPGIVDEARAGPTQ